MTTDIINGKILEMLTATALLTPIAHALRENKIDLRRYIDDICARLDRDEEKIQSLVAEVDRNARLKADAADLLKRFPDPHSRPPLFGVLIGVKDVIRTDGFPTRVGSRLPPELFAGREASCVSKYRAAGAIILGKTVTTEFTLGFPGPTRNPHNLEHTPGGSSSGSAAVVAAGFCPLAIGTQTGGSVIRPAAFCGVVGFKPTYGRIGADGIIHYSKSLDHIGLFTQDVAGMILAASIVLDDWKKLETDLSSMAFPVLGIPRGPYLEMASSDALDAFEKQILKLKQAGYRVRRAPVLTNIDKVLENRKKLALGELAELHKGWFAVHQALYSDYTAKRIMIGKQVAPEDVFAARSEILIQREKIEIIMAANGIDLWITPAAPGAAPKGLASTGVSKMNQPWTYTGHPVMTLPAGLCKNTKLPLGIQVIAPYMQDEKLLRWTVPMAQTLQNG